MTSPTLPSRSIMEVLPEYSSMDLGFKDRLTDLLFQPFREAHAAYFVRASRAELIMIRRNIIYMAGEVMGFFLPLSEIMEEAATAADTNCSVKDALGALRRISDGDHNVGVPEFQKIVGKLPTIDLRILEKFLEDMYFTKLRSEMGVGYPEFKVVYGGLVLTPTSLAPFRGAAGADFVHACILEAELMIRKKIINMAGKVKGFPPLLETATTEAAATAAESNYSLKDAMKALSRIPGGGGNNSGVLEFQRIVGKLPADDLRTLEKLLEDMYHMMLRSEMGGNMLPEVKAGDSFATKLAGQAIGVMVAKVAGAAVFGAFDTPLEPSEKAAGALGLMSVLGGMILQGKKPGLAKAMLKFGSIAIALGVIWSMAANLHDWILSLIFSLLAAAIVGVTATFA